MRVRYHLLSSVMVISCLTGAGYGLFVSEFSRSMIKKALGQDVELEHVDYITRTDEFYSSNFPDGNLFIHFAGLNGRENGYFIHSQFVRSSYLFHPRKVFISQFQNPLPSPREIIEHNSVPPDEWLIANGVKYLLTFNYLKGREHRNIRIINEGTR